VVERARVPEYLNYSFFKVGFLLFIIYVYILALLYIVGAYSQD
jgi:hypothetical protein